MAYGDGKYQGSVHVRIKDGMVLDRLESVWVPHSQWREEKARRGPTAQYTSYLTEDAQARAASHNLGLSTEDMIKWQRDPDNIAKFEELARISWLVPLDKPQPLGVGHQ